MINNWLVSDELFSVRHYSIRFEKSTAKFYKINSTSFPMTIYQIGFKGPEVKQIQQKLKDLKFYSGLIDGDFGGGTESAVIRFKRANRLDENGKVDGKTWRSLFPGNSSVPEPAIIKKPLLDRCLELTGAFETNLPPPGCYSAVSGNFDKQGISFGALQWNIGQKSLQPIFQTLDKRHPHLLDEIFHIHAAEWRAVLKMPLAEQLKWANAKQTPKNNLIEPWKGLLKAIGQRQECQEIQCENVKVVFDKALQLCKTYGVVTERAVALFFDIITQNGSINKQTEELIKSDFKQLKPIGNIPKDELQRLVIIADRRADMAKPKWREDVRKRKLTIANGQGEVHGSKYNLEEQYGLRLVRVQGL